MMLTEAKLLQFGSVGGSDGGKLKVYVVVDEASTATASERSQTALAQRIAESVIGEAAVWTWTRAGQVMHIRLCLHICSLYLACLANLSSCLDNAWHATMHS